MCIHRYTFDDEIPFENIEATLLLALWGTESMLGEPAVRLEAPHSVDEDTRTIDVDANGDVGKTLNRLLVGYLSKEYGQHAFRVERVSDRAPEQTAG